MKSNGILVKLGGSAADHQAGFAAAVAAGQEIKPLFTVAADPPAGNRAAGAAAALGQQHNWVLIKPRTNGLAAQASTQHPWDEAHDLRRQLLAKGMPVLTWRMLACVPVARSAAPPSRASTTSDVNTPPPPFSTEG